MRSPKGEKLKLAWFHREWLKHIQTTRRVQIEASKSHGKTTILLGFVVWSIGANPSIRIKLFAQSEEKARERLSSISDMILKNKLVKLVFPNLRPSPKGVWHKHALMVERENTGDKEPTLEASGIMGSVEGGRADIVICDDISDFRTSLVYPQLRESIKKKIYAEILPMLEEDGRAISIATPHHNCLHPKQRVLTKHGRVPSTELREDDELWIGPSQYARAKKITRRRTRERLYTIKLHGHPEPLRLTGGHRLPTRNGLRFVRDLQKNDELFLEPDLRETTAFPPEAIPREVSARRDAPKHSRIKSRLSREQLAAELASGATYGEIAKRHGFCGKWYVLYLIKCYGLPRRRSRQLWNQSAAIDPAFWRLVGYWLAEGDLNDAGWNNAVRFTFGKTDDPAEQLLVQDAKSIIEQVIGLPAKIAPASGGSSTSVVFRCKTLVTWLEANFSRGSRHKRLPFWFERLPDECKRQALLGWMLGDGDVHQQYTRVTSTSLDLISDWQRVIAGLGFAARINRNKPPKKDSVVTARDGRMSVIHNGGYSYVLHLLPRDARALGLPSSNYQPKKKQPRLIHVDEGKLWLPIARVTSAMYTGTVIDIATDSGYFSLDAVKSHNSDVVASLRENPEWKALVYAVGTPEDPFVPLWPERWPREALIRLRSEIGPLEYDRAFRCIAISEALQIIKSDMIQYYDESMMPDPWSLICVQAYDLAITESRKHSSYFAKVTLLYDPEKNIIFVAEAYHAKMGFTDQARYIVEQARKWKPDRIVVEETGYQKALREFLLEMATEPLPIFPVKPGNKSKELRLMETLPMFEAKKILFNPALNPTGHLEVSGNGDLIGQLLSFAQSLDKDLGDAFAYGVLALRSFKDEEPDEDWASGEGVATRMSVIG